ncbi:hypothetical protein PhCBS80983_g02669 [Powellomyces hirtus]|uniref:NAD-dependent protein deacetylase n=1 Tax=Powellomyces hirtus TaxID=109895 RepID=A0A507E7U0_9FUNG|nr:hypothetical protein PhCBS80983_g02669 [Powellomyces hirtus]
MSPPRTNKSPKQKKLTPLQAKQADPSLNIIPTPTLDAIADYIRDKEARRILVLTGAGISTSCGIPDFRSPGTGLYDNLLKYNLPYPEAIFSMSYFRRRPEAFYTLARELYPGTFAPSPCHYFIRLLQDKGLLLRNYTQNIDTLERVAGVTEEKMVEAHGSFADAKCCGRLVPTEDAKSKKVTASGESSADEDDDGFVIDPGCGKPFTQEEIKTRIFAGEIPICDGCTGLVKPNIVFFGEQLPQRFHTLITKDFASTDLVIVIGTSLQVQPFANLINMVPEKVPRLLINREIVGVHDGETMRGFDFIGDRHEYRRDALFRGDCDKGVLELAELMGWTEELEALMNAERKRHGSAPAEAAVSAKDVASAVGESVETECIPPPHAPSHENQEPPKSQQNDDTDASVAEIADRISKLSTDP